MRASPVLVMIAALAALPVAAQRMPNMSAGGIDCKMLASMPNAPMTVEACEQRMAMHAEMMNALNTPGGERPGDDKLTCAQIVEEMKTLKVTGVSPANAAEGKVAGEDLMASLNRAQTEAMALSATQTARTAGAASSMRLAYRAWAPPRPR